MTRGMYGLRLLMAFALCMPLLGCSDSTETEPVAQTGPSVLELEMTSELQDVFGSRLGRVVATDNQVTCELLEDATDEEYLSAVLACGRHTSDPADIQIIALESSDDLWEGVTVEWNEAAGSLSWGTISGGEWMVTRYPPGESVAAMATGSITRVVDSGVGEVQLDAFAAGDEPVPWEDAQH